MTIANDTFDSQITLEGPSAFEIALLDTAGALTDDTDMRVVRSVFEFGVPVPVPPRELQNVASAWLDASIVLRTNDLPRTPATLAGMVAGMRGTALRTRVT